MKFGGAECLSLSSRGLSKHVETKETSKLVSSSNLITDYVVVIIISIITIAELCKFLMQSCLIHAEEGINDVRSLENVGSVEINH